MVGGWRVDARPNGLGLWSAAAVLLLLAACDRSDLDGLPGTGQRAGYTGWQRVDDPERDSLPQTRMILDALEVKPGMRVADIGAGHGYWSFKLARLVGPEGEVFATEIDLGAVEALKHEKRNRGTDNLHILPVPISCPFCSVLPPGMFDLILNVDTYMYSRRRCGTVGPGATASHLRNKWAALKSGGRLVMFSAVSGVATGGETCAEPMSAMEFREIAEVYFQIVSQRDFGAGQGVGGGYLFVLRKDEEPEGGRAPDPDEPVSKDDPAGGGVIRLPKPPVRQPE